MPALLCLSDFRGTDPHTGDVVRYAAGSTVSVSEARARWLLRASSGSFVEDAIETPRIGVAETVSGMRPPDRRARGGKVR